MRPLHRLALAAAIAVLAGSLAGCAKNPVTGHTELSLISESDEIAIGVQSRPEILQEFDNLVADPRLQSYVSEVGHKLAAVGHRPNLPYSFEVLNSTEVNAFALPGGKVFITRGLLVRLSNEAQLSAVLGHEIGHVTAKHAVRSLSSAVLLQVPLMVGAAYAQSEGHGEYLVALGAVSASLLTMKFSRNHESESDRLGIDYSEKAGYNPEGMVQLLTVLKESQQVEPSKFENLFSTHPLTAKRIEEAQQIIARRFPQLDTMQLAWNPERFEDATVQVRGAQDAYNTFDMAETARNEGRYPDALQLYGTAIAKKPDEALFYVGRGLTYRSMRQFDAARTDMQTGIGLSSDLFAAHYALGLTELDAGNPSAAASAFNTSSQLDQTDPYPYFFLGQIAESSGDSANAQTYYTFAEGLARATQNEEVYGAAKQGLSRLGS